MTGDPIRAVCRADFLNARFENTRVMPPRFVVIHATASSASARNTAIFFAKPTTQFEAHMTVDDDFCYRSFSDDRECDHAPPLNEEAVGIEIVGQATWFRATWLLHRKRIVRAAYKTAQECQRYDIPRAFRDAGELREGKAGITFHSTVTDAFHVSTHTDPGKGFPRRFFMRKVRKFYRELTGGK